MADQKYTDSDTYQREIAEQYKKRVSKFPVDTVARAIGLLGLKNVKSQDLHTATVGNVNATYVGSTIVVKINDNRNERSYFSNKFISDKLSGHFPIPRALAYDFFDKTEYEVLVMERAPGTLLLHDIFDLTEKGQITLFEQVLDVVNGLFSVTFDHFGQVSDESRTFSTYTELLKNEFSGYIQIIRAQSLADERSVSMIEEYFYERVNIFDSEKPVFIHTDVHMGNILHQGSTLTALLDFDSALKAPKIRSLIPLLGFIHQPSQFVEGTKDFPKYKGKNFHHLLPTLKKKIPDVFDDRFLLQKLNLIGIALGVMWISDNWSTDWNKEMIDTILSKELASDNNALRHSYHGEALAQ